MASRSHHPVHFGLKKMIGGNKVYLGWGVSLAHGFGWFCQVYEYEFGRRRDKYGFGFSKNKFTAYRNALRKMK